MQIYDVDIIKLLPMFMRQDKFNIYLAKYLNGLLRETALNLNKLAIWNAIDQLNEEECDMLAAEMNIEYYSASDSIEEKHYNIKMGIKSKLQACTRSTIEKALREYSGYSGEIKIKEWFENENQFNHYKIAISNPGIYDAKKLVKALDYIGRKSSVLDGLEINIDRQSTMFFGALTTKSSNRMFENAIDSNFNWFTYEGKYLTDEKGNILLEV